MHILFIPSWYCDIQNYNTAIFTGIFIEEQINYLQKKNHKIGVIYPFFSGSFLSDFSQKNKFISEEFEINNHSVYTFQIPHIVPYFRTINIRNAFLKLTTIFEKYISENGIPDILHSHSIFLGGCMAQYLSKKYKIPWIHTEHSMLNDFSIHNFEEKAIVRQVLNKSDFNIFVSTYQSNFIQNTYLINKNKNIIINNLLNDTFITKIELPPTGIPFILTFIGNIKPVKNIDLLLTSLKIILNWKIPIQVNIIGFETDKKQIKDKIDLYKLNNIITCWGVLNREEIKNILDNSHALISTSKSESFGINLIESLARGRPVIATDSGGPREFINSSNGILVHNNHPIDVAFAIMQMIENYEIYNQSLISNECINKYNSNKIITEIDDVYKLLLKQKNKIS